MQAEDSIEVKILELLAPSVNNMGYEIVRVRLQASGKDRSLQIMIERSDGAIISVDDCEKVSRQVSAVLDIEDPIQDAYNLEISSPGIDRPLTRKKDFANFAGFDVKLETKRKVEGQGKFRGGLVGFEDDKVILDLNVVDITNPTVAKRVRIDFDNIRNAKLILTDKLISAYSKL